MCHKDLVLALVEAGHFDTDHVKGIIGRLFDNHPDVALDVVFGPKREAEAEPPEAEPVQREPELMPFERDIVRVAIMIGYESAISRYQNSYGVLRDHAAIAVGDILTKAGIRSHNELHQAQRIYFKVQNGRVDYVDECLAASGPNADKDEVRETADANWTRLVNIVYTYLPE